MEGKIYADYNATTPVAREVIDVISDSLSLDWANPSSEHLLGQRARHAIEMARQRIGILIDGEPENVTFMSGGTEANNAVLFGLPALHENSNGVLPHVITSNVEHDSIDLPLKRLEAESKISLTKVQVSSSGLDSREVIAAIRSHTVLITIMAANNETGLLMPLKEIGEQLADVNEKRIMEGLPRILFHSDGAQIIGKLPISMRDTKLDCFTIVGHKFYGPRIGALWSKVKFRPLLFGGSQEKNRRPGTENTAMIAGLGAAAQLVTDNLSTYMETMDTNKRELEKMLTSETFIDKRIADSVVINCQTLQRLPNTISLSFRHEFPGNLVLSHCDKLLAGVGAACHKSSNEGSPILVRHGITPELAKTAIRISLGRDATHEQISAIVKDLEKSILTLYEKHNDTPA